MIVSLLPGVREIRTPLVSGYLWLVAIWLIAGSHVSVDTLPDTVRAPSSLNHDWSLTIAASAVTFLALLLGLIAEAIYDSYNRFVIYRTVGSDEGVPQFLRWRQLVSGLRSGLGRLQPGPTKHCLSALELVVRERVTKAEQLISSAGVDLRELVFALGLIDAQGENEPARKELDKINDDDVRDSLWAWMTIRIIDQRDLLARRLISDNPELYATYDRLRSESEYRRAIAFPLMIAIVILAITWSLWIVFAVIIPPLLIQQSIRRGDQASDLLIDALLIERVKAPALEQLERATLELFHKSTPVTS